MAFEFHTFSGPYLGTCSEIGCLFTALTWLGFELFYSSVVFFSIRDGPTRLINELTLAVYYGGVGRFYCIIVLLYTNARHFGIPTSTGIRGCQTGLPASLTLSHSLSQYIAFALQPLAPSQS